MGLNVNSFAVGGSKLEGMLSAGPHHARLLEVIDLGIQNKLDPENKFGGNFAAMIGQPVLLTVVHQAKQANPSEKYAKIESLTKPMPGMVVPEMLGTPVVYDFDNPDNGVLAKLPEWKRKIIESAVNFVSPGAAAPAAEAPAADAATEADCPF